MPDSLVVEVTAPIGLPDLGEKITERHALFHIAFSKTKGRGDITYGFPVAKKLGEGFIFAHRIGVTPMKIFDEGCFQSSDIVALRKDMAGQRSEGASFLRHGPRSEVASPPRHDFKGRR